jgi:hypothetical protein
VHRRPLGRGRLLAAIGAIVVLVGCVLPWFTATGGTSGLTAVSTNALTDKGIVVFICALLILALVSLPYAAGDKPLAIDRALSYVIVIVVAVGAYLWRTIEFIRIDLAGLRPDLAPGIWVTGIGLVILARAAYEISSERRY